LTAVVAWKPVWLAIGTKAEMKDFRLQESGFSEQPREFPTREVNEADANQTEALAEPRRAKAVVRTRMMSRCDSASFGFRAES
jgi:hypothetical protein